MFDESYEVVLAACPATRAIHRRIRYQVYCLERGFEDPSEFPRGEEQDHWDPDSVQFVVRERHSGRCVGAIRLILPRAVDFPVEAMGCLSSSRLLSISRRHLGEVSRLCIIKAPSPSLDEGQQRGVLGRVQKSQEMDVMLGLLRAVMLYAIGRGIEHCYILVTDPFARLLRRIGLVLRQVGVATEHRGWRTPYLWALRESVGLMSARSPGVKEMFERGAMAYRNSNDIDRHTIDPDYLLIEPEAA